MIASRCLILGRLSNNLARDLLLQNGKVSIRNQISRHSHENVKYSYRSFLEPPGKRRAEVFGAIVWWWVTWHLFTDYHMLLPHEVEDPSKWTDEELGIPPLDE